MGTQPQKDRDVFKSEFELICNQKHEKYYLCPYICRINVNYIKKISDLVG
jgi:hypothetical protein